MTKKLSDKDKKDWQNFISNKEKVLDKDLSVKIEKQIDSTKRIDLHGFSLENANLIIDEFINKCFKENVTRIIIITGKGLRSNNVSNPYVSKDLSILKNSVPEFIKSNSDLIKKIKSIKEAKPKTEEVVLLIFFLKSLKNKFR